MKKSYSFNCINGSCFISDLSIYTGLTYKTISDWRDKSKKEYYVYFYFIKRYSDCDGYISVGRDYDSFEFSSEEQALKVFNDVKDLLKEIHHE